MKFISSDIILVPTIEPSLSHKLYPEPVLPEKYILLFKVANFPPIEGAPTLPNFNVPIAVPSVTHSSGKFAVPSEAVKNNKLLHAIFSYHS